MNDEIKEILDYLKNNSYTYDEVYIEDYCKIITKEENKKLLDYITNLQTENDKLKEQCKQWKENHKAVCIQRDIILNNTVKDIEEQIDYKSRNEKAIEYVNTHKPSDTISFPLMKKDEENQVKSCFDYEFREIYQKELLSILQGSDKE